VVSAFAASPAPPPPRTTPTQNKLDLPFEPGSGEVNAAATTAPQPGGASEPFLLSPETGTPPSGGGKSEEESIPPVAAESGVDAEGLVVSTDPDDSPPGALDLARWGAEELSKPRAETPIPGAKSTAQSATAATKPAFGAGESQKRGPLRFMVVGIAVAAAAALVVFALSYGRNEAKHSSLATPEVAPAAVAAPPRGPAAPSEAPVKATEHKPSEPSAPQPAAAGPALAPEVLKKKLDESMPALQGCLDQALQRDPALHVGKVVILATVAPSGSVTSTRIDKRTVDQSPLGACLKTATRNIQFPSFNGMAIPVDIPIVVAEGQ
jgi:hypothetical protein